MNKKKKAFTLTELLVVVLIIGVLSAVALPKFNRVIETRRTGEAEELLAAVRGEQEKRCSLDKKYAADFEQLGDIVAKSSTENFNYALTAKGAAASSKGKSYSVQMPSYRDGRLCCEGDYCEILNKNYPKCSDLIDLKEDASCIAGDACTENPNSCSCPAYAASHCECTGTCDPCAGKTCSGASSQSCPSGTTGTQTRTCTCGVWGAWQGTCTCTAPAGEPTSQSCPVGQTGTQTRIWNTTTCSWNAWQGKCTPAPCAGMEGGIMRCESESQSGHQGTWNYASCTCACPSGTALDGDGQCSKQGCSQQEEYDCTQSGGALDQRTCECRCPSGQGWNGRACKPICKDWDNVNETECLCPQGWNLTKVECFSNYLACTKGCLDGWGATMSRVGLNGNSYEYEYCIDCGGCGAVAGECWFDYSKGQCRCEQRDGSGGSWQ